MTNFYFPSSDAEVFNIFMTVYMGALLFIGLGMFIIQYIFNGIATYNMAKRRGVSAPYTAFIPFARFFLTGKLAEQFELAQYGRTRKHSVRLVVTGSIVSVAVIAFFGVFFPFMNNAFTTLPMIEEGAASGMSVIYSSGLLLVFSLILMVASYLYVFFNAMANYKIFRSQNPRTCVLFTILSLVINPFSCFALFAQRKRDDGFIELNDKFGAQNAQYQA